MDRIRLAVPTKGVDGISDVLSEVFARSPTFTYIDIENGEVKNVYIEENKAIELKQGAGPLVVKNLKDKEVDAVIAYELGPGAKTLLEMSGIQMIQMEAGTRVSESVKKAIKTYVASILN